MERGEPDTVAEVEQLLNHDFELLVAVDPVRPEPTDRSAALEDADVTRLEDGIRRVEAQAGLEIPVVRKLEQAAAELDEVGGRLLLRHRSASISEAVGHLHGVRGKATNGSRQSRGRTWDPPWR